MSDGAPTPLHDLRVVEISDRIAGGYCGKLLVDAGAEVVKSNRPPATHCAHGPRPGPRWAPDSPLFSYLAAGKRSRTSVSERAACRGRHRDRDRNPARGRRAWHRSGTAAGRAAGLHRRHDLRLRLDRSVGGSARHRVHPAGRLRAHRVSAAIRPARPSRSAATWGSTWAVPGPPTARWRCITASAAADGAVTSTCPCSRRSR